jgi:hypothetical protein
MVVSVSVTHKWRCASDEEPITRRNEMSKYSNKCNFGEYEIHIAGAEGKALDWWWRAGVECVDNYKGNASKYAEAAYLLGTKRNSEGTIRVNVGAVVRAMKAGYSRADFDRDMGIDHVKETLKGSGQREAKKSTPKSKASKVVGQLKTKAERRAAWELLNAEFAK